MIEQWIAWRQGVKARRVPHREGYCHCIPCRRERSERMEAGKPPEPPPPSRVAAV